jgi:hypothetical protein
MYLATLNQPGWKHLDDTQLFPAHNPNKVGEVKVLRLPHDKEQIHLALYKPHNLWYPTTNDKTRAAPGIRNDPSNFLRMAEWILSRKACRTGLRCGMGCVPKERGCKTGFKKGYKEPKCKEGKRKCGRSCIDDKFDFKFYNRYMPYNTEEPDMPDLVQSWGTQSFSI